MMKRELNACSSFLFCRNGTADWTAGYSPWADAGAALNHLCRTTANLGDPRIQSHFLDAGFPLALQFNDQPITVITDEAGIVTVNVPPETGIGVN